MKTNALILAIAVIVNRAIAQDYQDYAEGYEEDNLYQNYAMNRGDGVRAGG